MGNFNGRKFAEKKKKNKVEEIQLVNLARPSQAENEENKVEEIQLTNLASLGSLASTIMI